MNGGTFLVVGSGPSGIACATALLDRGHAVTLIDAGITLEREKEALLAPLQTLPKEEWSSEALALLRNGTNAKVSGLPRKLAYGSDFTYRSAERELGVEREGVACVPSFAQGGYSTVWGAAILPYRDADIGDWPIRERDLAPHYRAVLSWIAHCAVQDRLDAVFPTYSSHPGVAPISRQAVELMADLEASSSPLAERGFVFGRSRLAIDPGCIRCGMCMYGCPRHLVFCTADSLTRLMGRKGFSYEPGVVVERVREAGGQVVVEGRSMSSRQSRVFRGDRAFLGCGVFSTTRILLTSLEAFDREIHLKDSQHYVFPLLRDRRTPGVATEPLHTLAQIFLEILDPEISRYAVHLQLYSYSDLYVRVFQGMFGPLARALPLDVLLERMWIVQGYLHSEHSARIAAVLTRASSGDGPRLRLRWTQSAATVQRVKRVLRKLTESRRELRMTPVAPLLKVSDAGGGHHIGGGFPMRAKPEPFESDVLGRPHGFERVHVVDATVFPSIPASTITFTILANAHRIASQVVS